MSERELRMHWLPWPAIAERARSGALVLIPTGAVEQHGPHLPLVVDALLAESIALGAARQVSAQIDILVAPALTLGYSGEHLDFAGTLSLRPQTLLAVYADVIDSLVEAGFRRLCFLNGHGGNEEALALALREARRRHQQLLATGCSYWRLAAQALEQLQRGPVGIAHGGEIETALMAHLAPASIDRAALAPAPPGWSSAYLNGGLAGAPPVFYGRRRRDLTATGHTGDPTLANAEQGAGMFEASVAAVASFLLDYAGWPFPSE